MNEKDEESKAANNKLIIMSFIFPTIFYQSKKKKYLSKKLWNKNKIKLFYKNEKVQNLLSKY